MSSDNKKVGGKYSFQFKMPPRACGGVWERV